MNVTVFHANPMPDGRMYDPDFYPEPNGYTHVAVVEVPEDADNDGALGQAWQYTNHIDRAWWDNPGVTRVGPPCRSTSVGDVLVVGDQAFRVDGVGWSKVSHPVS